MKYQRIFSKIAQPIFWPRTVRFVSVRGTRAEQEAPGVDLDRVLRVWRRKLRTVLLATMAARLLAAEALLAALTVMAVHLGMTVPVAVILGVGLLIVLVGAGLAWQQLRLSIRDTALLLDQRLHLHDQLSSALDPEAERSVLAPYLERRAASLAAITRREWRVLPVVGDVAAILAVAVVLGAVSLLVPNHPFSSPAPTVRRVAVAPVATPISVPRHVSVVISVQTPPPAHASGGSGQPGHHTGALKSPYKQHAYRHTAHPSHQPGPLPPLPNPVYATSATSSHSSGKNGASSGNGQSRRSGNGGKATAGSGHAGSGAQGRTKGHAAGHGAGSNGAGAASGQSSGHSSRHSSKATSAASGVKRSKGAITNPYAQSAPFLRSLPKPGLIEGKQINGPTHSKGSAAGSSAGGKGTGSHTPASGRGHRLVLPTQPVQSAGNKGTRQGSSAGSSSRAGHVSGQGTGPAEIDYISPDENPIAAPDSQIVQRYFAPHP